MRLNKGRKGAVSYLIRMVLALFLVLLVVYLVVQTMALLTNFGVEQECQAVVRTGGIMQYINPNAPIRATKPSQQFSEDVSLCPVNRIVYKQRTNHDLIIEDIANEMISCYNKYGRGEVNLFEQSPGREMYCIMCTHLIFDDVPGPIDGLYEYMDDTDIRGLGVTYTEFLAGLEPKDQKTISREIDSEESLMIDTENSYAIYYIYGKTVDFWNDDIGNVIKSTSYGAIGGTAVGIVVIAATGATWWITLPVMAIAGMGLGGMATPETVADEYSGAVMITEYDADIIRKLQCTSYGAMTEDWV